MRKPQTALLGLMCVALLTPLFVTNVQAPSLAVFASSKDASLNSDWQAYNFGADPRLDVGATHGGGYIFRSLVQFDLPPALSGATIHSAYLTLGIQGIWNTSNPAGEYFRVCRILQDWVEGTGTWAIFSQDGVTWNEYDFLDELTTPANDWTKPGGYFTYTDSSVILFPSMPPTSITWNVTDIVKGWVDGTYPNYGFLIKIESESPSVTTGVIFASKEQYGSGYPIPQLAIFYTVTPTGVPEFNITLPIIASIATIAYLFIRKRNEKTLV